MTPKQRHPAHERALRGVERFDYHATRARELLTANDHLDGHARADARLLCGTELRRLAAGLAEEAKALEQEEARR